MNLVNDEIVSVTNGNIHNYEPISELKLPDGSYATTLKATVSVSKLTSFCEGKGYKVEFSGETYAINLKNIELNKSNEIKVLNNLNVVFNKELPNIFSFRINTTPPKFISDNIYQIIVHTQAIPNNNFSNLINYISETFNSLSINNKELETYKSYGINSYELKIKGIQGKMNRCFLRNKSSLEFFYDIMKEMEFQASNTEITDGIQTLSINKPRYPTDNYEYYSAFQCFYNSGGLSEIPIDLSYIKINKVSLLDSYIKLNYNLKELGNIKAFSVKKGIAYNYSVIDAEKLCKKIDNTNSAKNSMAAFGIIIGIPAITLLIGLLVK